MTVVDLQLDQATAEVRADRHALLVDARAAAKVFVAGGAVEGNVRAAEAFGRVEDPGVAGVVRNYWGGYLQASYFVLPTRLQVAGRLGRSDLPLYGAPADEHLRRGTRTDEQSVAVSGYLRGHRIKLQVDYSHLSATDATTAPEIHRVRAAAQVGF